MKIADVGPVAVLTVGREIRIAMTVTTEDGETTDVQRAVSPSAALNLARRLIIEAQGR